MADQGVIDEILAGVPEPDPSEFPSYVDGGGGVVLGDNTGVDLGRGRGVSRNDFEGLMAKLGTLERRVEAGEELHRRCVRALSELRMLVEQLRRGI